MCSECATHGRGLSVIAEAVISGRRAEADRKRELQGMLRLILIEIKDNKRNAEIMLRKPDLITYSPAEFFADDAWLVRHPRGRGRAQPDHPAPHGHDPRRAVTISVREGVGRRGLVLEKGRGLVGLLVLFQKDSDRLGLPLCCPQHAVPSARLDLVA